MQWFLWVHDRPFDDAGSALRAMAIDTLKAAKRLREAGFTEPQAEAVIAAVQEGTGAPNSPTRSTSPSFAPRSPRFARSSRPRSPICAVSCDNPSSPRSKDRGNKGRHPEPGLRFDRWCPDSEHHRDDRGGVCRGQGPRTLRGTLGLPRSIPGLTPAHRLRSAFPAPAWPRSTLITEKCRDAIDRSAAGPGNTPGRASLTAGEVLWTRPTWRQPPQLLDQLRGANPIFPIIDQRRRVQPDPLADGGQISG